MRPGYGLRNHRDGCQHAGEGVPVPSEEQAIKTIDALLDKAGWRVCDMKDANIHAARIIAGVGFL